MYFLIHSKSKICSSHRLFGSNHNLAIDLQGHIQYRGKSNLHSTHLQFFDRREYMEKARLHLLDQDNQNYYRTIYRLELFTNLAH